MEALTQAMSLYGIPEEIAARPEAAEYLVGKVNLEPLLHQVWQWQLLAELSRQSLLEPSSCSILRSRARVTSKRTKKNSDNLQGEFEVLEVTVLQQGPGLASSSSACRVVTVKEQIATIIKAGRENRLAALTLAVQLHGISPDVMDKVHGHLFPNRQTSHSYRAQVPECVEDALEYIIG